MIMMDDLTDDLRQVGGLGRTLGRSAVAALIADPSHRRTAPSTFRVEIELQGDAGGPVCLRKVISVMPAIWPKARSSGRSYGRGPSLRTRAR